MSGKCYPTKKKKRWKLGFSHVKNPDVINKNFQMFMAIIGRSPKSWGVAQVAKAWPWHSIEKYICLVVDLTFWKIWVKVSWDHDIPNWMESHKSHVGGGGFNPSEKYDFVSWDYDIPNWMERHKNSMVPVTTKQILKPVENRDPLGSPMAIHGHDTGPPKAYAASPGQGAAGAAYSCRSLVGTK